MIRLREILSLGGNLKLIKYGLDQLSKTTHLVGGQLESNWEEYSTNFDENKFSSKIGTIHSFLGSGVFGAVFRLNGGKTLKITFDFHEAPFIHQYCYKNPTPGFVVVNKMYEDEFGNSKCFYIIRDPIEKIGEVNKAQEVIRDYKNGARNKKYGNPLQDGVSFSLQAMYNIDDGWRGTHVENIAIQNGKVVLYDGFSKGAGAKSNIEKF